MLVPGFGKKHVIFIVGLAALAGGLLVLRHVANTTEKNGTPSQKTVYAAPAPAVTYDDYKKAAAAAIRGFVVGDAASTDALLGRLTVMRVPREGMAVHQELTIDIAAYREALKASDPKVGASALNRLRSCAQANPWLGLSI